MCKVECLLDCAAALAGASVAQAKEAKKVMSASIGLFFGEV